jgi:hypothetical protein
MESKVFGTHDERTLAQMDRCMNVGSVVGGVRAPAAVSVD